MWNEGIMCTRSGVEWSVCKMRGSCVLGVECMWNEGTMCTLHGV